jgi:ABC-type nickel/cobalt efflux system permease component RcnA
MIVFDGSAALISVPTLVLLGWYFADVLERVRVWISQAQVAVIAALVAAVLAVVVIKVLRRRRRAEHAAAEALADQPDRAEQPMPRSGDHGCCDAHADRHAQASRKQHPTQHHASTDPRH